jgi:hypothetical protein
MEQAVLLSKGGANDAAIVSAKIQAKFMKNKAVLSQAPKRVLESKGTSLKAGSLAVETTKGVAGSSHGLRRAGLEKAKQTEAIESIRQAEVKTAAMGKCADIIHKLEEEALLETLPRPMQMELFWHPKRYNDAMFNTKAASFTELVQMHPELGLAGTVLAGVGGAASTMRPDIVVAKSCTANGPIKPTDDGVRVVAKLRKKERKEADAAAEALKKRYGDGEGDGAGAAGSSSSSRAMGAMALAQEEEEGAEGGGGEDGGGDDGGSGGYYQDEQLQGLHLSTHTTQGKGALPLGGEGDGEKQYNDARPAHHIRIFDMEGLGEEELEPN